MAEAAREKSAEAAQLRPFSFPVSSTALCWKAASAAVIGIVFSPTQLRTLRDGGCHLRWQGLRGGGKVKRNGGRVGVDGMGVERTAAYLSA